MADLKKKLIVVGDRILVRPEHGEERTGAGLYLPQAAISARQAQGGWVVTVGPGVPIPEPGLHRDAFFQIVQVDSLGFSTAPGGLGGEVELGSARSDEHEPRAEGDDRLPLEVEPDPPD